MNLIRRIGNKNMFKFIKKLFNDWERIDKFPDWINYKMLCVNHDVPGVIYTFYFRGKSFRYKYQCYRGFENHGHGSDSYEKFYRKLRERKL